MQDEPLIIGLGGTTRPGSSSEKALTICLRAAEREGARILMLAGPALDLPMYAPEKPERSDGAQRLIDAFRQCDGIVIASPSYHGTISGMLKNALDYTEDLSRDERVYFDGCAVGLIACAAGWQGAGHTLATLRAITHSLRGWPTPLGAMLNTSSALFDNAGECIDPSVRSQLEGVGRQVVQFTRMRKSLQVGHVEAGA
jgi:FMN reductase